MSSTGPGSLLVFLAFLMLSMLLVGAYFTAYFGLLQAGGEVQKAGEAAVEQAIIYLFQYPTEVTIVNGNPIVKGETRIAIQNVGSRDITFDRILAISPGGSVVADVKVPGNKGLGVRQWQMYRVQDLGLPDRWSNFDTFRSEVARLVLLSERGRTHGSIWGVPPFLEGVLKAMIVVTVTGPGGATTVTTVVTQGGRPPSQPSSPSSPSSSPSSPSSSSTGGVDCRKILEDPRKEGTPEWCDCAAVYAHSDYMAICLPKCLTVYVVPCCSGAVYDSCLASWDARGGQQCVQLKRGETRQLTVSWRASWSFKSTNEGKWQYVDWAQTGGTASCSGGGGGTPTGSASGTCTATVPPSQNAEITIIFEFVKFQQQPQQQKPPGGGSSSGGGGSSGGGSSGGGSGSSGSGSSGSGSGSGGSGSSSGSSGSGSPSSNQPSQQQPQPQPQPSYPSDPTQQNNSRPRDYAPGSGGGGGGGGGLTGERPRFT
jgi:hypothetical protein